jgi:hypothetical protein
MQMDQISPLLEYSVFLGYTLQFLINEHMGIFLPQWPSATVYLLTEQPAKPWRTGHSIDICRRIWISMNSPRLISTPTIASWLNYAHSRRESLTQLSRDFGSSEAGVRFHVIATGNDPFAFWIPRQYLLD